MANFSITPNMNLTVPTVGAEPGPTYASDINASLTIIDGHNHSAGSGVQINPNGLNINDDLSIGGNSLTLVKTVNFQAQSGSLAAISPNLGCVYVAGNELVYNDEVGNVVPLTNNGSVNAGAGSITGLPSGTASASYSSGSSTFVWQSATNTPASTDTGSVIFRNLTASSKGITVSPQNSLAANYSLILPLLPVSTSLVSLDSSGNFGTTMTAALADTVAVAMDATGANAVANTRTRTLGTTVGAGGVAISASCGSFSTSSTSFISVTNLSVTLTTTGRPVYVGLIDDGNGTNPSSLGVESSGTLTGNMNIAIRNGVTLISRASLADTGGSNAGILNNFIPISSVNTIDTSVNGTPGTYTYTVIVIVGSGSYTAFVEFAKLIAYEI